MKKHILYCTINVLNGKYYIGVHNGSSNSYLGSGTALKHAIRKHGVENFVRITLEEFDSKEEAFSAERDFVTQEFIDDTRLECYNEKPGGSGGWRPMSGRKNPMKNPEVVARVVASRKASITQEERNERSARMSELRKNGTIISPGGHGFDRTGLPAWNKGLKLPPESEETKAKKSESQKKRGRDMGALARGKKFNMRQRTCPHCQLTGAGGNMTRYHFDACSKRS